MYLRLEIRDWVFPTFSSISQGIMHRSCKDINNQVYCGGYERIKCDAYPNKNLDLADLNMFYLILDQTSLNQRGCWASGGHTSYDTYSLSGM